MAIERVKEYFRQYDMEERIIELSESSATVELAAQALGCEPARIAKSLSFMVDEKPNLIICAGDVKVDNAKYKARFAAKAKMLTAEQAQILIGHAVGGVCPFGINEGVTVYLDESLHAAAQTALLNCRFRRWNGIPVMRNGWMSARCVNSESI